MLASENLHSRHYNESIFKQKLNNAEPDLALQTEADATQMQTVFALATAPTPAPVPVGEQAKNAAGTVLSATTGRSVPASVELGKSQKMHCTTNSGSNVNVNNNNNNNKSEFKNNNTLTMEPSVALIASHTDVKFESFIRECVDEIIKSAVLAGTHRSNKVVEWHDPAELLQLLDFKLQPTGECNAKLLHLLKQTIQYSVKTGHPYFINQLYSGVDPYALVGQWLTDALNPSVYTYEVAPVFTLMEEEVLGEMRRIVGFPNNGHGDGIFCPGGSIANGYAISCARYKYVPESKQKGLFGTKRLIVFTSADAHYSVEKLAMFMGVGSENVCKVPTNKIGKMDLDALKACAEKYLNEGCQPFMVSATAGTTVLGAFDNLDGIADICQKYNMWMHVDAAWGGGALISKTHRYLLKGIERADSVTWNPHKLLSASQQCSTFLTRHKDILSQCHSTNATYLFQKDKFYDTSYDTGDKHIQCGRRADVFKFWFMWKAKGTNGLEAHIDQVFKMAHYFTEQLRARPGFELVLNNPECTNISFWYVPPSLRSMPRNEEFYAKLHAVAPKIKEGMIKKGSMMITYQPLEKLPNFFRLVLQNSCLNEVDMLYFLNEIETLGSNL